jgi:hypothetical protein
MGEINVNIYPHKMLEWGNLDGTCIQDIRPVSYTLAIGLTRPHPELRSSCYLTSRHTYRTIENGKEIFQAVGESVYRISYKENKLTEEIILKLVAHSHEWFANEFNEKKNGSLGEGTIAPDFSVKEVLPSIRESLGLAGYL